MEEQGVLIDGSSPWDWPRVEIFSNEYVLISRAERNGRRVAIKRSFCDFYSDRDLAAAVANEEEALIKSRGSRHVVRLLDARGEGHCRELMFEWLEGEVLEDARRAPLSMALQIFREVAHGVAAIHRGGFLHADIQPGNIMLCPNRAVVLDLGSAYPMFKKSYFGTKGGSEWYRPPERFWGGALDPSTDVYGLALILYFLLKGDHAFSGDERMRIVNEVMPPLLSGVPDWVNPLIQRATRTRRHERFQSIEAMLAAMPS